MQQAKISVIIPVYNVEKYLMRCVGSVLKQTYKNIEIILVNDGSKDCSGSICDNIATLSDKVRVIHQENRGVSVARNEGLKASTGEYIHFCDADDFLEQDAYENIMEAMVREDADAAYFGWSRDTRFSAVSQADNALRGIGTQYDLGYTMLIQCGLAGESKGYGNYIWNKIFRKEALVDKATQELILFDESVAIAEDGIWLVDILPNLHKGVFFPEPYYHYVNVPGSVMGDRNRYIEVRLGSQRSHLRMLRKLKEIDEELYHVHQKTCNGFFWMHLPYVDLNDDSFIEETIKNLYEVNEGKCPEKLLHTLKEYMWVRDMNRENHDIFERRSVKLVLIMVDKLRKIKRGIFR